MRAEAIVKQFDPGFVVYHHSGQSGCDALDQFLPEFRPRKLDDWFEHWSTKGVKLDVHVRIRGSVQLGLGHVPAAGIRGKRGGGSQSAVGFLSRRMERPILWRPPYQISDAEKANIRWEAKQWSFLQSLVSLLGDPFSFGSPVLTRVFSGLRGCIWPTTGGRIAPGVCRRIRRGSTSCTGRCGRASIAAARSWPSIGTIWQRPGFNARLFGPVSARAVLTLAFRASRAGFRRSPGARRLLRNNMPLLGLYRRPGRVASPSKDLRIFLAGRNGREADYRRSTTRGERRRASADKLGLPEADVIHRLVSLLGARIIAGVENHHPA